MICSRII
jgi:transcriptional regulator with XRE-family HTH domain